MFIELRFDCRFWVKCALSTWVSYDMPVWIPSYSQSIALNLPARLDSQRFRNIPETGSTPLPYSERCGWGRRFPPRPTLLSLLEAFVYDPLVEWSAAGGRGVDTARKDMEMAVSLSLFVSRVQEMRTPLQARLARLLRALPALDDAAAQASTLHRSRTSCLAAMVDCEGGRAEAEAAASSAAVDVSVVQQGPVRTRLALLCPLRSEWFED